jgi:TetR/AcrR family transcriptional repressor of nem operon
MPRVSRQQTEHHRAAIEEASSRLFRERGFGVSVADVMGDAGLTHGGFYGHFASKDELTAVACAHAFEQSIERWQRRIADKADDVSALQSLVDGYLSTHSRNAPGAGCPAAALANDVAREPDGKPVRAIYVEGIKRLLGVLQATQDEGGADPDRALVQLSTMLGALVLARATASDPISSRFLAAARAQVAGDVSGARRTRRD